MAANIGNALKELLDTGWKLDGIPTNETEFNEMFSIQTGTDEIDTAILSNNPDDFGITWEQVSAKAIELEAAKEAKETQKETDQANGNQKLLDLGLTQAEATALTGYTPPEE